MTAARRAYSPCTRRRWASSPSSPHASRVAAVTTWLSEQGPTVCDCGRSGSGSKVGARKGVGQAMHGVEERRSCTVGTQDGGHLALPAQQLRSAQQPLGPTWMVMVSFSVMRGWAVTQPRRRPGARNLANESMRTTRPSVSSDR